MKNHIVYIPLKKDRQYKGVKEYERKQKTWRYTRCDWWFDGYSGKTNVSFDLFKEKEGTRLKLTHKGIDTLPEGIDFFNSDMFNDGWIIYFTKLIEYL